MQVSHKVVSDKHCKSSDVLTCMQSDANFHFVVWPVSDTEVLHSLEDLQTHGGDLCCVLGVVPDREPTDHHVGVTDSLNFVDVVRVNDRVKTGVELVEKVNDL